MLLLLGGFIFLPLFFLGAFVAWSLIDDLRNPTKPEDHPFFDPKFVPASDTSWLDRWLALCESPAETKFLRAVLDAYGLSPSKGKLVGNGLSLDLQVKLAPYRVDFLANDRLVVEVDGAAYHSSPEEVARDAERDETLRSRGYTVLRIPARLVFNSPGKAVDRLRTALASRLPQSEPVATVTTSEHIANLLEETRAKSRGMVSIKTDGFSSEIERKVMAEMAEQESARKRELAAKLSVDPILAKFHSEAVARIRAAQLLDTVLAVRVADEVAMASALRKRSLEEKLDENPELRRVFEEIHPVLDKAARNSKQVSAYSQSVAEAAVLIQAQNDAEPPSAGELPKTPINLGRLDANAKAPPAGKVANVTVGFPRAPNP
ncbi:DUF559 domain-containing protein [Rhodanobacter sp. Root179]|uniref:endonuclease domain-containing protein n=1 Tax=Rhodanobacter sp. Root179 TaxID=1736482 RepID=UPI0009E7E5C4|nr:DUF559 domain-containing protein [Rhodanobacter sp. Root179]